MEALLLTIFDLIGNLLSGRNLWGVLALATALLTLTLLGVAGRVAIWLETIQYRDRA